MLTLKTIFLCAAIAVLCVGCDGVYIYSYEGKIYRGDGVTPARNVPIQVRQHSYPNDPAVAQSDHRTDDQGRYTGSFFASTGWVFALRPPAPELQRVYLFTPSAEPIEISLTEMDQKITVNGRHLTLPTISLPSNP